MEVVLSTSNAATMALPVGHRTSIGSTVRLVT
jgi:hypothetical protein